MSFTPAGLKKVNKKVQDMPQPQTATNPRQQEEEKKDINIHAQNKQTLVREAQRLAPSSPCKVIRMLKQMAKREQRAPEDPLKTDVTQLQTLRVIILDILTGNSFSSDRCMYLDAIIWQ